MSTQVQFDWDGSAWSAAEVGDEPTVFAFGVMDGFAFIIAGGSGEESEFFTLGSNPGLEYGDPEWIFAQNDPDHVVARIGAPAARAVVDRYLSRLEDEAPRGLPRRILDEIVGAAALPPLPW
ncbi:hypothetical protein [Corynebacterium pacaense]|uniref:hypothetical protein n=1 Tax=Corynebacterium pacaense TaxID=1816684 RepID=UPI0009BA0B0A|nr:hypothetical protein [Corynebacterium pacaense]